MNIIALRSEWGDAANMRTPRPTLIDSKKIYGENYAMESILELPQRFQESDALGKAALQELISLLPFKPIRTILSADSELLTERLQKRFMVIEEGRISCVRSNILLFVFTDGDLLGLDVLLTLEDVRLQTTFAVPVLEFPKHEFYKAVESDPILMGLWCRFLMYQLELSTMMTAHLMKGEFDPGTSIKTFLAGQSIVRQGENSTEVFTLVDGSADVIFDGVKVGEIGQNEIFGVLSALGGIPRTATVVARNLCTVVEMPKEHFIEFFKSRPTSVLKMVEDMAISIARLNQRVAQHDKSQSARP